MDHFTPRVRSSAREEISSDNLKIKVHINSKKRYIMSGRIKECLLRGQKRGREVGSRKVSITGQMQEPIKNIYRSRDGIT